MGRGESRTTKELIDTAVGILEAEHPMTVRQLFYRLASIGALVNNRADYQKVSRLLTTARQDARCSFDFIVDRSRPEYSPNVFEDLKGYAQAIKRSYRKDYWTTQPLHVEVWTEKDAIIGSIERVTDDLGVAVRVSRGYSSTTRAHEIALIFKHIDKPIHVFYLGDHDPEGHDIERDLQGRITSCFTLKRLAICPEDIARFNLPPLRVKESSTRATAFQAQHGNDCVELDALPPTELRGRIENAVTRLLDKDLWERAIAVEKVELRSIEWCVRCFTDMRPHHGTEGAP